MAKIGKIVVGGRETGSGVAFQLLAPAPFSHLYVPSGDRWEVEICKGETNIVARTSDSLNRSDMLANGLEQVQRCLDLLSYERGENLLVKRAGNHFVIFVRDGAYVAQHVMVTSLSIGVSADITTIDRDGNIVPPKPMPP